MEFNQIITIISLGITIITLIASFLTIRYQHSLNMRFTLMDRKLKAYTSFLTTCNQYVLNGFSKDDFIVFISKAMEVLLVCEDNLFTAVNQVIRVTQTSPINVDDITSALSKCVFIMTDEISKLRRKKGFKFLNLFRR